MRICSVIENVRHRLSNERGYTLIELLMATIAGLIVCSAALAIVVSSLQFSINDSDRVDSDQEGSVAMEKIVQALNSSCVLGQGISSIVGSTGGTGLTGSTSAPPSSANSITFYSSLTDTPTISNPNEIVVYLSSYNGPLDMATYQYATGSYGATPSSIFELLPHAAPPGSTKAQGSTTPIFTYYGYGATTGTLTTQYSPSPYSTSPLGVTDIADVGINFQSQPSDGNDPANGGVDLSDAVALRLSAASNYPQGGSTGATVPTPCA
jgi:type II secretory pathway pseudopilin PulG